MELISIIVPIYKVESYLRICIESILSQTYRNLEIILVDDGSPDQCGAICDEYAEKDSRVRVIHKENGGVSDARNKGLDIATGCYIGFVDGDDYIDPDMFQTLYQLIQEYNTDLSMVSYNNVINDIATPRLNSNTVRVFDKMEGLKFILIDQEIQSYLWNKLFKAEIFRDIRLANEIMLEDVCVMLKIFKRMTSIVYLESPKYNYVFREGSIVNDYDHDKEKNCLTAIVENYHEIAEFPDLDIYRCFNLILWMVRIYWFMVLEKDKDVDYFRDHLSLFQEALERHRNYIIDNLDPIMRIVLYAILWDLNKGREIVNTLQKQLEDTRTM